MSTLTQRFLNEVDTNSVSKAEREKIAEQLEALTIAERELGATEYEAERAAVQTMGKTLITKSAPVMRLPAIWQTAGIWSAASYLLHIFYIAGAGFMNCRISNTFAMQVTVSPIIDLLFKFFITVTATFTAIAWDHKMGFKGALLGIVFGILCILVNVIIALSFQKDPIPSNLIPLVHQAVLRYILGVLVSLLGVLVTPHIVKCWEKKKRRSL
jgi:hypothetical protein